MPVMQATQQSYGVVALGLPAPKPSCTAPFERRTLLMVWTMLFALHVSKTLGLRVSIVMVVVEETAVTEVMVAVDVTWTLDVMVLVTPTPGGMTVEVDVTVVDIVLVIVDAGAVIVVVVFAV
jgi:hypothetical protein